MDDTARYAGSQTARRATPAAKTRGKRMSDQVAWALLVYTGLLIFITMKALEPGDGSMTLLPYFSLIVLVAAIIPACRKLEQRWLAMDETGESAGRAAAGPFMRDSVILWGMALGLPFAITAIAKAFIG